MDRIQDAYRFRSIVDQLVDPLYMGRVTGVLENSPEYRTPEPRTADACRAMDIALMETVKYISRSQKPDPKKEEHIASLWIEASKKVAYINPSLAEALHFKGMGWLDNEFWDIAEGRSMKISVSDMQEARQKIGYVLHREDTVERGPFWERIAIFGFGVAFTAALLAVALFLPNPTDFQYTIVRIILALSAAGVAALIPGFIDVQYRQLVRAGGAMAVFVVVFFFSPASLVSNEELAPTDPFRILIVSGDPDNLSLNTFTFPVSDIRKRREPEEFIDLLTQLPGQREIIPMSTTFRLRDEGELSASSGDPLAEGNDGVLVLQQSILHSFDDNHLAFTYIMSQIPEAN